MAGDSELVQLQKTKASGGLNPVQQTRYDQLMAEQGSGGGDNSDPVALAKSLIQVQQQANQPAIQTLQGNIGSTQQKYNDLVDSIKGAGTVAANNQTQITNNALGARGILPSSQLYQQELQNALLPVNAQFSGLAAQTGLQGQEDINSIMNAIAQLQSGNPASAVTSASGYAGAAQQALAQIQASQNQLEAARANPFEALGNQGLILNRQSGNVTDSGLQALLKALNGL